MKSTYLAVLTIGSVLAGGFAFAGSQYDSGVSDTEIKIGNTMPYSGPASAWGMVGKSEAAYFAMINDQGGVNGRKINFISRDDGYSPPTNEKSAMHWKALEMIGQGCLLSLATTNFSDAAHITSAGIAEHRSTGATVWLPLIHWTPHCRHFITIQWRHSQRSSAF